MVNMVHSCPFLPINKKKVLFIMGSTGTGKSKLSVSMGTHFPSEIINSDKMQVYKGLDIITNKISGTERRGIPHHLLGIIKNPDLDFTVSEFCSHVLEALSLITERGHLPIIVGGSNNYLQALVEDPRNSFRAKYDCCFIWLDASLPVLFHYLGKRVDQMLEAGLLDEIREAFVPGADYSRGVRRAIGVPELDQYIKVERNAEHEVGDREELLREAIKKTKENTYKLAESQLGKIQRLKNELGWEMNKIDASKVFEAIAKGEEHGTVWEEVVFKPSLKIVQGFLQEKENVRVEKSCPSFELSRRDGNGGGGGLRRFCLPHQSATSIKICPSFAAQPSRFSVKFPSLRPKWLVSTSSFSTALPSLKFF